MKLPPGHVAGQGVSKPKCTGGFGERMLRSMGWQAGHGLGKEGTGIKEAIQVKKKEDTVGVGGNGSYAWGDKWWEKAFDSALQTVGDSSSSSDSSDSDSDDEQMAAIAAAVNRDGTRTSASAEELKLLASLSKGGRVAAGRFGGRDAKMARIRQQEATLAAQAAAKLGVPSAAGTSASTGHGTDAQAAPMAARAAAGGGSDQSDTTSEVKLSGSGKKRKAKAAAATDGQPSAGSSREGKKAMKAKAAAAEEEQQQQPPAKKQRIVIEPVLTQAGPSYAFVPTPATGWWGEKRFASAGCLEGLDKAAAEAQRRRMTFDEDDQARIFNTAQARKTQGKVGLGQGTGTVKFGGVKWEGKRVSFEEQEQEEAGTGGGSEAEEEGAGQQRGKPASSLAAKGSCTELVALASCDGGTGDGGGKKRSKAAGEAAAEGKDLRGRPAGPAEGTASWQEAVKWKKMIVQQLEAEEKRQLRLKELQRRVVADVLAKHGGIVSSKAAVKAAFSSRLQASSKFVVEGKLVRLRG